MFIKNSYLPICVITLAGLVGCGGAHRPLKPIKKEKAHFIQTKNNVELRVRVLTDKHCQKQLQSTPDKVLLKNAHKKSKEKWLAKPHVLQISVTNNGAKEVKFDTHDTSLKLLSKEEVFQVLKKRHMFLKGAVIGLAVLTGVAAVATAGLAIALFSSPPVSATGLCLHPIVIFAPAGLAVLGAIPIMAAGGVTGYCIGNHKDICVSKEIRDKVHETLTIEAGDTENLLLLAHELPKRFTLSLTRKQAQPIVFDVKMPLYSVEAIHNANSI